MLDAREKIIGFASRTDGAVTVYAMFFTLTVLLLGGVAIDYNNGIRSQAHLRVVVDAAALAAALDLPDENAALASALTYAAANAPPSIYGTVVQPSNVEFGRWDSGAQAFTASVTPTNAVRVQAYRNSASGNSIRNMFMGFLGRPTWDIAAESVAIGVDNSCGGGGLFTTDMIDSGSNNSYDSFCLYGKYGVKISSDNSFASGSKIEMPNLGDFSQGGSNSGVNSALQKNTHPLPMIATIDPIVNSLSSGSTTYVPSWATNGPVFLSEITDSTKLESNTFYVVGNVADFGSNVTIENIVVVAKKEVKTGSNVTMRNVLFASKDKILFGSNNDFGTTNFCSTGKYSVTLFAKDNIEFGSQSKLRGVLIASRKELKVGSEITEFSASLAQVGGKITFGSAGTISGCSTALTSDYLTSSSGTNYAAWGLVH